MKPFNLKNGKTRWAEQKFLDNLGDQPCNYREIPA